MRAEWTDVLPAREPPAPQPGAPPVPPLVDDPGAADAFSGLLHRVCRGYARHARAQVTLFLLEAGSLVPVVRASRSLREATAHFVLAQEAYREQRAISDRALSACAVPLIRSGTTEGVLVAAALEADGVEELVGSAAVLAGDLAAILDCGRLYEEASVTTKVTAATRRLLAESAGAISALAAATTVARLIHEELGTDHTIVFYRPDHGTDEFEITSVGMSPILEQTVRAVTTGVLGNVSPGLHSAMTESRTIFVDRVQSDQVRAGGLIETLGVTSYLSLPLLTSAGHVGHVLAGHTRAVHHWTPLEREFVQQVSAEASLIMESARLRESDRLHREQLTHQATHDPLTGLPNRRAFGDRLAETLADAAGGRRRFSVALLDLDRFKAVNDTLGHHSGDKLLVEVARSLLDALRGPDFLARLGGDEFAVILPDTDQADAARVAARLADAVDAGCRQADIGIAMAASIGTAVFPDDGTDSDRLLQKADAAMYDAKRSGVGWQAWRRRSPAVAPALSMENELREAMREDQLTLLYQPKVRLDGPTVAGAEALVRWHHPRRGLLGPEQFLPVLESSGLMPALTSWVLAAAVDQAARWRRAGLHLPIAVNVPAPELANPGFLDLVEGVLRESALPPTALTLELTEQAVVSNLRGAGAVLDAIRGLGTRISIDDFGTGYSSLAYLESLPVDELKVDRSFILRAGGGEGAGTVLRAIIRLGHELGLTVVAEGVETAQMTDYLRDLGCDEAQGYYFAGPLRPPDLEGWVAPRR